MLNKLLSQHPPIALAKKLDNVANSPDTSSTAPQITDPALLAVLSILMLVSLGLYIFSLYAFIYCARTQQWSMISILGVSIAFIFIPGFPQIALIAYYFATK